MARNDLVLRLHPHHVHHAHQPSYRHVQVRSVNEFSAKLRQCKPRAFFLRQLNFFTINTVVGLLLILYHGQACQIYFN